MRSCGVLVLLACSPAFADEGASDLGVHTPLRWEHPDEPVLHLDPIPPLATEGLGAKTARTTQVLQLGPHARLVGEGESWTASLSPMPPGPEIDDVSRGWRAGYSLSYDLGPFSVGAAVDYGHVDSGYERGTYRYVGLSIYRTFRLSRWMLAWIALSAGRQTWLGVPPPGEHDTSSLSLTIGTTFR